MRASVLAASTLGTTVAVASLWESNDWALTGDLAGELRYNSNVYGFKDAPGDTSFTASPTLTMLRKGSATDLRVIASADMQYFFDLSDEDSTDPSLGIYYGYPKDEEALLMQEARLTWRRWSYPDFAVGNRIRNTAMDGSWNGTLRDTGKTRIVGNAMFSDVDYSRYETDVFTYGAGLGLAWSPRDLFEYRVTYSYTQAEYDDAAVGSSNTERSSHYLNFGVRGDFTPKISGQMSIGFGQNEYSGSFSASDFDWSTSADVTWRPSERRSVAILASRGVFFSALGDAYSRSDLNLNFRQGIAGGFSGTLRSRFGNYNFDESGIDRSDTYYGIGASLEYDLTGRFNAGLGYNWSTKDSDTPVFDFSSYDVYLRASWRF